MKNRVRVKEFLKYSLVGGITFLADFFILWIVHRVLLDRKSWGLYVGTAFGFIGGMLVNHLLSVKFVFQNVENGKNLKKFMMSLLVGLVGLALTEFGMFIGTGYFHIRYEIVKILVTAGVFVWNYMERALWVYRERSPF